MRATIALLFVLCAFSATAEQLSCTSEKQRHFQSDPAILTKIQRRYATITTLRAPFSQSSYLAALDTSEASTGFVVFQKPGRMRWRYEAPEVQEFGIDDKLVTLYQASDKQAVLDRADRVLLSDLPVAFLLGVGDIARDFAVRETCAGEGGILLRLVPKDKETQSGVRLFSLIVSSTDYSPLGAEVQDEAGNTTTIRFGTPSWNVPLTPGEVAVQLPKGIDIIDRRSSEAAD
jgi:outer membrane lipoprotein carrier protein